MNLKRYLLLRMALVAGLCWLVVSLGLVGLSARHMKHSMVRDADQMQSLLEAAMQRQHTSPEPGPRTPHLWQVAGRFTEPFCLRYQALNGSMAEDGCERTNAAPAMPSWLASLISSMGLPPDAMRREIHLWGQPVGMLTITPERQYLLDRHWKTLRDLLWLATATVLALGTLIFLVIDRALRPAGPLVEALDRLAAGEAPHAVVPIPALPGFKPREFARIADGINRLSARLSQLAAMRNELMGCLIKLQENERRELAHDLHDEFGQCVAALSANSATLKSIVSQGEMPTDEDFESQENTIDRMLTALRSMLLRMSPPLLESRGLAASLNDLITGWQAGQFGMPAVQQHIATELHLDDERALCVYRVIQEALNNISRHARDSTVIEIDIRVVGPSLQLSVTNGLQQQSPALRTARDGSGMGLRLLAERVQALGGQLFVEPSAGHFAIRAILPAIEAA